MFLQKNNFNSDLFWFDFISFEWYKVHKLRDSLTQENYQDILETFLLMLEGNVLYPYLDSRNHWTIGAGLLIKRKNSNSFEEFAKIIFKNAFGINLSDFININDLKNAKLSKEKQKEYSITLEQSKKLLSAILKKNETHIKNRIPFYQKLSLNEKIVVQSIWYHCPNLIGNTSSGRLFIENLKNTSNYLAKKENMEIIERDFNSHPLHDYKAILRRRFFESAMFSCRVLDFAYRIPNMLFKKILTKINIKDFKIDSQNITKESFYNYFVLNSIDKKLLPDIQNIVFYIKNSKN